MGVVPEHHRQGIGRQMLEFAETWLRERDIEYLQVKTLSPRHPDPGYVKTRAFYLAVGFRPARGIPRPVAAGEPRAPDGQGPLTPRSRRRAHDGAGRDSAPTPRICARSNTKTRRTSTPASPCTPASPGRMSPGTRGWPAGWTGPTAAMSSKWGAARASSGSPSLRSSPGPSHADGPFRGHDRSGTQRGRPDRLARARGHRGVRRAGSPVSRRILRRRRRQSHAVPRTRAHPGGGRVRPGAASRRRPPRGDERTEPSRRDHRDLAAGVRLFVAPISSTGASDGRSGGAILARRSATWRGITIRALRLRRPRRGRGLLPVVGRRPRGRCTAACRADRGGPRPVPDRRRRGHDDDGRWLFHRAPSTGGHFHAATDDDARREGGG